MRLYCSVAVRRSPSQNLCCLAEEQVVRERLVAVWSVAQIAGCLAEEQVVRECLVAVWSVAQPCFGCLVVVLLGAL